MRVYLCSDMQGSIKRSGVGRAFEHQQMALQAAEVPYTLTGVEDFEIIHINTVFPQSYFKAKQARRQGVKVIFHAHSTMEDFKNSFKLSNRVAGIFGWWLKRCYETADLLLTPSHYAKDLLLEAGIETPIKVLSNGIDLDFWQSSEAEQLTFRQKYGIGDDEKLIISVGLQIKRKGILDFVEMAQRMPDYQFMWFGFTDKKLLPKEVVAAIEADLPNLHFPGYIEPDELRVAYQTCDLYVFLTHEETEGIVLLEALASHANVIVRDIPVFAHDYVDRLHLYKGETLDDFVELAFGILEGHLPSLVDAGYVKVAEKSIENIGRQLAKYYQELLFSDNNRKAG